MLLKVSRLPRCFYGIFSVFLSSFCQRLDSRVSHRLKTKINSEVSNNFPKDTIESCPPPRQCRLAIICWMEGGSSQQGCGNEWLYACCMQLSQTTVKKRNPNYRQQLPKFKQKDNLQSSFSRRRYDSSENQLTSSCGIPRTPANTLQSRIIGGRPAIFAEYPWQAHIRIKEFQCGGGESSL